jgi:hypothetical protein
MAQIEGPVSVYRRSPVGEPKNQPLDISSCGIRALGFSDMRLWIPIFLIAGGVTAALTLLPYAGFRTFGLTTANPGMLGTNTWSTSQDMTTVTLKVEASPAPSAYDLKGAYTITFRTSKAHIVGITNAGSLRGERAVAFRFWSKSFDPVMPDYVEYSKLCPTASAEGGVECAGSRYDQRLAAGERDIRFEVWNGVDSKAEVDADVRKIREPGFLQNCHVEYVEEVGMLVLAAPKSLWPNLKGLGDEVPLPSGNGCYHFSGGRSRNTATGRYERFYMPYTFAVRFEPEPRDPSGEVSMIVVGAALPAVGLTDRQTPHVGWMSVRFGHWKALAVMQPWQRRYWVSDGRAIQEFLRRVVVSTTGSEK